MEIDTLIGLLGLLLGLYTIVPTSRRLELNFKFSLLIKVILLTVLLLLIYLSFYRMLFSEDFSLTIYNVKFDGEHTAFVVLIFSLLLCAFRFHFAKLNIFNIPQFERLASSLYWDNNYQDLTNLLENNYNRLFQIANFQTWPFKIADLLDKGTFGSKLKNEIMKRKDISTDIIWETLLKPDFVNFLAENRPYLGVILLNNHFHYDHQFAALFMKAILSNRNSVFYHEIDTAKNFSESSGYNIPDRCKLLKFIISDQENNFRLNISSAVGDFAIDELENSINTDRFNEPFDMDIHTKAWKTNVMYCIRYFDMLICEATVKNEERHMGMAYLPDIFNITLQNLNIQEWQNENKVQMPNIMSYFLYEIIDLFAGWMRTAKSRHGKQMANNQMVEVISQILSLCLYHVARSSKLPEYMATEIYRRALKIYFELEGNPFAEVYLAIIVKNNLIGPKTHHIKHMYLLKQAYDNMDKFYLKKENREHIEPLLGVVS